MIRRLIFVVIIGSLQNFPVIQLQMQSFTTLLYMIYIFNVLPFKEMRQNFLEVFNEVCMMMIIYVYMFFKQSFEANYTMGSVFIYLYVLSFTVNLLVILYDLKQKAPTIIMKVRNVKE